MIIILHQLVSRGAILLQVFHLERHRDVHNRAGALLLVVSLVRVWVERLTYL